MEKLKHKVRSDVFESLIDANIRSLSSILLCNKTELCQTTKLDLNTIDEVIKETSLIILSGKVYTANCVLNQQYISTGCPALNAIMRGGIPRNGITEIVGSSGVGKTQMCLQLSLMTQLPLSLGGLGKSVIYICTEDIFPVKRLSELAQIFSLKYKNHVKIDFEDNIFLEHIADIAQLKKCLFNTLPHLFTVKNVGLIVIDSIAGVFRSENLDIKYPKVKFGRFKLFLHPTCLIKNVNLKLHEKD
ncbi:hypothetical protein MTP99_010814 [Tenebrio molitor]|nr:hypothetical protein MTP99_010814 [Tenebrio molitor]